MPALASSSTRTVFISGEARVNDGVQWLSKCVFTLPEPGKPYAKD